MVEKVETPPETPGQHLKNKQRNIRESFNSEFGTRVHRAISWIIRSENETDDHDARFIFLWIAFNAAYSAYDEDDANIQERARLKSFFETLRQCDNDKTIYEIVWQSFPKQVRSLLNNQYIYAPFWKHHHGATGYENWYSRFKSAQTKVNKALSEGDTVTLMTLLFDRLYVLRNQIIHGGSTWGSAINRSQIKDGSELLQIIVPQIIDLMLDNSEADWGSISYAVVE